MEASPTVLSFNKFKINPELNKKIKDTIREDSNLKDIQFLLDTQPELVDHVIKSIVFPSENKSNIDEKLFNDIITKLKDVYNKFPRNSKNENTINKLRINDYENDYGDKEEGIELREIPKNKLNPSLGGRKTNQKSKNKRRIRRSKKNRFTPRYKKKSLRKKTNNPNYQKKLK
jgi:hypothetical protein